METAMILLLMLSCLAWLGAAAAVWALLLRAAGELFREGLTALKDCRAGRGAAEGRRSSDGDREKGETASVGCEGLSRGGKALPERGAGHTGAAGKKACVRLPELYELLGTDGAEHVAAFGAEREEKAADDGKTDEERDLEEILNYFPE